MGCTKRYIVTQLDQTLIKNCSAPELKGKTWRDVAVLTVEQKASIEECNGRLQTIRKLQEKTE
jgi:hypothetical protein